MKLSNSYKLLVASVATSLVAAEYKVTSASMGETADHVAACQAEFGAGASQADWNDLKGMSQTDLSAMLTKNNIVMGGTGSLFVTVGGQKHYGGGNRVYFMSNFEAQGPPPGFLEHDKIFYSSTERLSSGSWYGINNKVLCNAPGGGGGAVGGDPHFKRFGGSLYDFHGACDLVLLKNAGFKKGLGLSVHIRTKIKEFWSYVETAAIKIGDHTLEVKGGPGHAYWLDGVQGERLGDDDEFMLSGLKVNYHSWSDKQRQFRVDLANGDAIAIAVYADFVSVNLNPKRRPQEFEGTLGMMGSFPDGAMLGRDGLATFDSTTITDFANEWQVHPTDPQLFHTLEGPQHPDQCLLPVTTDVEAKQNLRRRLGQTVLSHEDAELACARLPERDRDICIFDVMATNDLNMAGSYGTW